MSTGLIDAVAGIAPGSALDAARAARPVAREQVEVANAALFESDTERIPRRERLLVGAFATSLIDPSGALAARRLAELGAEDRSLVASLVASAAQEGPWGSYREPGLVLESRPGEPWRVPDAERDEVGASLAAVLEHAHLLLLHPRDARAGALARLVEAGWDRPDIVTWSQLVSFVAFQARLAAGLGVLAEQEH